MEALEKKVLKTACQNLMNTTITTATTVQDLHNKIANMKRGIADAIALINTLMEDDPNKQGGITLG